MRVVFALSVLSIARHAIAFPAIAAEYAAAAAADPEKRQNPGFDAKAQLISTSGANAFVAPGNGDQRGPCPGLNALANHNYIPHNGVGTISQFIDATTTVFGMGLDLATFLAVYGAVMDGDLKEWSIGGPAAGTAVPIGLLSQPQGISYSHNKYESDVSPTRGDLYKYGNAYLVQLDQFKQLYAKQSSAANPNYNLPVLTEFRSERFDNSVATNPYFFNAPFSGVIVQPAAYTFIYRFMANHTAAAPEGILGKDVLKSFFSITGTDSNLKYTAGYERIPDNWYRRAFGDEYTIPYFNSDLTAAALQYPKFLSVGGNTGKDNSFAGVDLSNITGGVYNSQNILKGNNLACFGFEGALAMAPDLLKGLVNDVTAAAAQLTQAFSSGLSELGCPQLQKYDTSGFAQFPGYTKLKSSGTY